VRAAADGACLKRRFPRPGHRNHTASCVLCADLRRRHSAQAVTLADPGTRKL